MRCHIHDLSYKNPIFHLACPLPPSQKLVHREVSCCVVSYPVEMPGGEDSAQNLIFRPIACEKLNPANSHKSELGSESYLSWVLR